MSWRNFRFKREVGKDYYLAIMGKDDEKATLLTSRGAQYGATGDSKLTFVSASPPGSPSLGSFGEAAPFKKRAFLLLCACVIPFGGHFMKLAPAAVKSAFLAATAWIPPLSNAGFGVFLSAINWANLFLPAFQGKFIDKKGSGYVALVLAAAMLAGHALFCWAVGVHVYWAAVAGRVLFGAGEGGTSVVEGVIVGRWFRERELAFAMGITESAHYVSKVLGKGLPAKLASMLGGYDASMWACTGAIGISSLFAFYTSSTLLCL